MQQLPTNRSCGPCRGCCLPWTVPEVGKLDASWCPKSTPCNGCSIYETRPQACKDFACLWLNGKGQGGDRPDILGVMMDVEEVRVGEQLVGVFHFWEIEAGALNKPRVAQIADANKNAGHVIAYHEKTADNLYTTRMRFSAVHFTDKDVRAFSVAYRMKNLLP